MSRLHRVGRIVLETHAPSTSTQWLSAVEHVQVRAQQMRIKATDYHLLVVGQDPFDSGDASCRHWQVGATAGLGQREVAKALVPDMSDWVPMWTKRAGNSLKRLWKHLQYTEPMELLTCFACLLGDSAIDNTSTD
jgi:hypothetical protein